MEDWPLQELLTQHSGGSGGPHPGAGATLDSSVPCAEVKTAVKDLVINIPMVLYSLSRILRFVKQIPHLFFSPK